MDDLKSPFYLVHGRDPLEGRLSNLQNYHRYLSNQTMQVAVQKLRKLWKLHTKLLTENRFTETKSNRKVTKASDLNIGQLVFIKDHCKGPFWPHIHFWPQGCSNSEWKHCGTQLSRWHGEEAQHPPYQTNVSGRVDSRCFPTVTK